MRAVALTVVLAITVLAACGPREPQPEAAQHPAGTPSQESPDGAPAPVSPDATAGAGAGERDVCSIETNEVWADACRRGVTFRAIGQEPGWLLEIDGERGMLLSLDYGETRIEARLPAPQRHGQQLRYSVRTDAGQVDIAITEAACRDIMSGEAFPTAVSVTVAGWQHDGCGRPVGTT
jgi:uncharacterized membrane protein